MLRKEMGMIFQSAALFDSMTVLDNVMFPLNMFSNDTLRERTKRAMFCLDRVNLGEAKDKFPGEISGGMQKRVAIARAIALNPQYLFCDEPNSGLDPKTSLVIDDLIHDKSISDIKIHNAENIRIKRNGKREGSDITFPSEGAYKSFVTRLLERNKVNLGTANAIQTFTDADQEDFILRLAVIGGLLIVGGSPLVVIRKIPKNKYSLSELSDLGMFGKTGRKGSLKVHFQERFFPEGNEDLDSLFSQMIESRGILFTGKGASGKTTLMNACIEKIPESDSVMICQENAELFDLHHPDIIAAHVMVNGGDSKVSYNLGDLTRVALLVDLDRVIVGEVKEGSEAAGLSKASMTGHKCWTSVHGANCEMAVEKMADYISQATGYGNREALKQLTGFEYVVHLSDFTVDEIVRIVGFDATKGKLILRKVYPFEVSV